ncbi:MAG: methyltransferase [Holophagaceae bacterium]|nr:methyltransferase [Holophagaceae bacterium]
MSRTGKPKKEGSRETRTVYRTHSSASVESSVKIERLAWGGKGMARMEDGRILLLAAPLALFPGEQVLAQVIWKARHGEGEVQRWITADPKRVPAACPVALECGGCDLWEAGNQTTELKRQMVEDLFHRQLPAVKEWRWLPAPRDTQRHRIQLHWDGSCLGFHQRRSHRVVPIKSCPVAASCLSEALPRLEEALKERMLPTRAQRWELATGTPAGQVYAIAENGRTWSLEPDGWHASTDPIRHSFGGHTWEHRAGGFFQVCAPWAMEAFHSLLADWGFQGATLFDLYGGVGLFSGLLGNKFQHRVLVEADEAAVSWARKNLEHQGLSAECVAEDVEAWLPASLGEPGDGIVVDPPRAGLAPGVVARLLEAGADRMVLVGCDGAAFCRDVQRLSPAWELVDLAAVDLFPNTIHVECVGIFRRRQA